MSKKKELVDVYEVTLPKSLSQKLSKMAEAAGEQDDLAYLEMRIEQMIKRAKV